MIEIDGAEGEGGGQVVRTALALSLVTGQAFRVENIRAGRPKPGLMRQHLTAVEAACAIGGARCEELHVGATTLTFHPGRVTPGEYRFAVGTAGSTGLALQTVLPPLMLANMPSRLVIEGGTHNIHAPPFDFLARAFLPVIARMGPGITARLIRPGFYPAGGGRIEVEVEPVAKLTPVEVVERGALVTVEARALVAALDGDIAERELAAVERVLGWPAEARQHVRLPDEHGPGNILLLEARFEHATEIVSGFGQLGVSATHVGEQAAERMRGFLAQGASVGPYLADQLLIPMALAGAGAFSTVRPTPHTRTCAEVIRRFLDVRIATESHGLGHLVTVAA